MADMTNLSVPFTAALLAGLALAGAAQASSCDLPDPPGCARDSGRFDDRGDFENCRREMGRYRADVGAHLECIRTEYEATALRFDSRARR